MIIGGNIPEDEFSPILECNTIGRANGTLSPDPNAEQFEDSICGENLSPSRTYAIKAFQTLKVYIITKM